MEKTFTNAEVRQLVLQVIPTLITDGESARKLPIKLAYALKRNRDRLAPIYQKYDNDRMLLLRECAQKDADGEISWEMNEESGERSAVLTDEDRATFGREHEALLREPVVVEIHAVTEATIEKMESVEVQYLDAIEWMMAAEADSVD